MQVYVQKSMATTFPRNAFASISSAAGGALQRRLRSKDKDAFGVDAIGLCPLPSHDVPKNAMAIPRTAGISVEGDVFMVLAATNYSVPVMSIGRRYLLRGKRHCHKKVRCKRCGVAYSRGAV